MILFCVDITRPSETLSLRSHNGMHPLSYV